MVVHPCSHRVSRVRRYSGYSLSVFSFAYGTITRYGRLSHTVRLDTSDHDASPNPENPERLSVWPVPRSLATTCGISVDVFSCPYLDVSVQGVPLAQLCIHCTIPEYCSGVFPHSDIPGSQLICSSPRLFAACHVLLRLLMPRHSPCALISLTFVETNFAPFHRPFGRYPLHSVCFSSPIQSLRFELVITELVYNNWFS